MANIALLPHCNLSSSDHWTRASELRLIDKQVSFKNLLIDTLRVILPNGIPRGIIAEVCGKRSTGRTSVYLSILAEATRCAEVCAVVDLFDSFHPASAAALGVRLEKTVWIRCHGNAEHAIRSADLLLHAGGFGIVVLDLSDANTRTLNRIPLSYWYRFRRAIEQTPTILLLCAATAQARSCSSIQLQLNHKGFYWTGLEPFFVLRGLKVCASVRKKGRESFRAAEA